MSLLLVFVGKIKCLGVNLGLQLTKQAFRPLSCLSLTPTIWTAPNIASFQQCTGILQVGEWHQQEKQSCWSRWQRLKKTALGWHMAWYDAWLTTGEELWNLQKSGRLPSDPVLKSLERSRVLNIQDWLNRASKDLLEREVPSMTDGVKGKMAVFLNFAMLFSVVISLFERVILSSFRIYSYF